MIEKKVILVADDSKASWKMAEKIQIYLGTVYHIPVGLVNLSAWNFSGGEFRPELRGDVKGSYCFHISDSDAHPATWWVANALAYSTLRTYGASCIEGVSPILHWARQDKSEYGIEPKDFRSIASIQKYAREVRPSLDGLITLDPHSQEAIDAFQQPLPNNPLRPWQPGIRPVPVRVLNSYLIFAHYLVNNRPDLLPNKNQRIVAASTDKGRSRIPFSLRDRFKFYGYECDMAFGDKERDVQGKLKDCRVAEGDVKDAIVFVGEDMIAGGGTAQYFTRDAKQKGARKVIMLAGHGLFCDNAIDNKLTEIDEIFVTDSLMQTHKEVSTIPMGDFLSETIAAIILGRDPQEAHRFFDQR